MPNFWNEQGICIPKNEYQIKLLEKRNDTSAFDQLTINIKGQDIFEVLENFYCLLHPNIKVINGLPPLTYAFSSELNEINREMLVVSFPTNPIWQRVSTFANKWKILEEPSTLATTSLDMRT